MDNPPKILVVDDEPTGREALVGLLLAQDYYLAVASSGAETLTKVPEFTPDVILLDVMMPGMNGFEVCRRLKAEEQWQHIPIILVTALDSREDLVRGLDAGADDFLSKPVSRPELQARIRSMLRIKKQYDDLKDKNEQLETMLQLREDLSNMIVHDIRVPLSPILGFSELLLLEDDMSPQHKKDLTLIRNQAYRLNSFLNDMLVAAKMEQDKLLLNQTEVDLKQLILSVQENLEVIAKSRKIELTVDLPPEFRQVSLDANLFQRVLDNLVSNALKFSPLKSAVRVQLTYLGDNTTSPQARIQVFDAGPGVAPENRERIFDKFQIVGLKQKGVSQVGLGLAFCKQVVEAHGGRIFVEANVLKGSIFTVEI